jgi:Big-like domain-containing protein
MRYAFAVVLLQLGLAHGALAALAPAGPDNPGPPDTPRTGTVMPYPLWYKDGNGLTLGHCLDNLTTPAGLCLTSQPDLTMPQVFPSNYGAENFYWIATSNLKNLSTGGTVSYVADLTSSFFNTPPPIIDGNQTVFARIRIRVDVPVTGTYTITHPYGVFVQNVTSVGPGFEINATQDVGCLIGGFPPCDFTIALRDPPPGGAIGPVSIGPFLTWDLVDLPVTDAAGNLYIGNPATPHTVVGSPFATNFVRIDGPAGSNIGGAGIDFIQDATFLVSGKLARGPLARDDGPVPDAVNTMVTIPVLANDIQPPPGATIDPTTVAVVAAPAHGTAVAQPDGTVIYTPMTDFRGVDTFRYTVNDTGNPAPTPPDPGTPATSNIATVSVSIPTTTTTTMPCTTPRCMVDKVLNGSDCVGQSVPTAITSKFNRAVMLLDEAGMSSSKKAKRLDNQAKKVLSKAKGAAKKAARKKKNPLSSTCATSLEGVADNIKGSI